MWTILKEEFRSQLKSPFFWFGAILIGAFTSMMNPNTMLPAGNEVAGGLTPHMNTVHAYTQLFSMSGFFVYTFIASIMGGLPIIRDRELRISEIIHSTPLTGFEYVVGKYAGVVAALVLLVTIQVAVAVSMLQIAPNETFLGPFNLGAILLPVLTISIPLILFCSGITFTIGFVTGKPLATYVFPVVLFLLIIQFFWAFNPPGLPAAIDHALMLFDPTALRWITRSYDVDQGIAFYNSAPMPLDLWFVLNRAIMLLIPTLAVAMVARKFRFEGISQTKAPTGILRFIPFVRKAAGPQPRPSHPTFSSLKSLNMTSSPPGLFAGTWSLLTAELRELRGQVGLYLLIPFAASMVMEFATVADSISGEPMVTAGTLATNAIAILTGIVCFVLLFYTVESVLRDRTTQFDNLLFSSPIQSDSILFARALTNAFIVSLVLAASIFLGLIKLVDPANGPVEIAPFLWVWVVILFPTFFVWNAFVTMVASLTRERYSSYAIGIGALAVSFVLLASGKTTWATNWSLWGTLRWSDMGAFELYRSDLILNRLLILSLGVLFVHLTRVFFVRRERNGAGFKARLNLFPISRGTKLALVIALVPLTLGSILAFRAYSGFQGGKVGKMEKAFHSLNVARWNEAPVPTIKHMELKVLLQPNDHTAEIDGSFLVVNQGQTAIETIPINGLYLQNVSFFDVQNDKMEAVNTGGLFLVNTSSALMPQDSTLVRFSYLFEAPSGSTMNGGSVRQFILESGVVLNDFLPKIGFDPSIGQPKDEQPTSKPPPIDFWKGEVPPIGISVATGHIEVSAPEAYTISSVGNQVSMQSSNGQKTTVFEWDKPVLDINIIAGKWDQVNADGSVVFYHPEHSKNADGMLKTLISARKKYSEWFYPYPWADLRLSEYPNVNTNARSYPTNIAFSESAGFLARPGGAFTVVAHEAAHQWFPHILVPGEAPGADVFIEGKAQYATLLLHDSERGLKSRIDFSKKMEQDYLSQRRFDGENPLFQIINDGSSAVESTIYNKGAWVMWMLHNLMNHGGLMNQTEHMNQTDSITAQDPMLIGLRHFIEEHRPQNQPSPNHNQKEVTPKQDFPTLQDLTAALRPYAPDTLAFDQFVWEWFSTVVLPEFEWNDIQLVENDGVWHVSATLTNVGTGTIELTVAAEKGARFNSNQGSSTFHEARTLISLSAGQSKKVELKFGFRPDRILVDPDAVVLQLNRGRSVHVF